MSSPLPPIEETPDGPQALGASADLLVALLAEFDARAQSLGVPIVEMPAGIGGPRVAKLFGQIGLEAPQELDVWFGWHNGSGQAWAALPLFVAASAESATRRRAALDFEATKELDWGVEGGWVPLEEGNYGCAVEATRPPTLPPRLRMATPDFHAPALDGKKRAVSLCTVVAWWLYGIESAAHRWDSDRRQWLTDTELLHESQRLSMFYPT